MEGRRLFPIFDAINLDGVHGNTILANNHSQVFHFRDFELAFLGFEI